MGPPSWVRLNNVFTAMRADCILRTPTRVSGIKLNVFEDLNPETGQCFDPENGHKFNSGKGYSLLLETIL